MTIADPLPEFEVFVASESLAVATTKPETIQDWMTVTAKAQSTTTEIRRWCTLKLDKLTEASMDKYFDRSALGALYQKEYDKKTEEGIPFAWLQMESDLIFSLHRCMAARHRGRLMTYRDDCSQKNYHTFNAVSQGLGKYSMLKQMTEKNLQTPSPATLV